jgi:hypothetical protein
MCANGTHFYTHPCKRRRDPSHPLSPISLPSTPRYNSKRAKHNPEPHDHSDPTNPSHTPPSDSSQRMQTITVAQREEIAARKDAAKQKLQANKTNPPLSLLSQPPADLQHNTAEDERIGNEPEADNPTSHFTSILTSSILIRYGRTSRHTHATFAPKLQSIITKYLHISQVFNTELTRVCPSDTWFSPYPHEQALGASPLNAAAFLTSAFTWFNPSDHKQDTEHLAHAIQVTKDTQNPTRMILLLHDCPGTAPPPETPNNTHIHTIATFPPDTLSIEHDTLEHNPHYHRSAISTPDTSTPNTCCLKLILVENHTTPPFHWPNLQRALSLAYPLEHNNNITTSQPPWHTPLHPTAYSHICIPTTLRTPIRKQPGLTWLRRTPQPNHHYPSPVELLSNAMGIGPPQLRRHLIKNGYDPDILTPERLNLIRTITLQASLKAYERMEFLTCTRKYGGPG